MATGSVISKQVREFVEQVQLNAASKGPGWPKCFTYDLSDDEAVKVGWNRTKLSDEWRRLDSWAVAFFLGVQSQLGVAPRALHFEISTSKFELKGVETAKFYAFCRRVSYLQVTHPHIAMQIKLNQEPISLYSKEELQKRPENEMVREQYRERGDDDRGERLEKDFQAFLSGKGLEGKNERCDRLALLGDDFIRLKGQKVWGVDREFPTGVFKGSPPKEANRILPTEFIDLVSVNRFGYLSIIELKVDDICLEVISQLLDYALFFRGYCDQLLPIVKKRLATKSEIKTDPIHCYVANNHYHPKFANVARFYGENSQTLGITLIKLTLGATEKL